jgi:hypothetical protein
MAGLVAFIIGASVLREFRRRHLSSAVGARRRDPEES